MNRRGAALILVTILLVVLTIFSTALISSSFSENGFALRYLESTQAFWLAEAGLSQAITRLRAGNTLDITETELGKGGYNATIQSNGNNSYTVNAVGFSGGGRRFSSSIVSISPRSTLQNVDRTV